MATKLFIVDETTGAPSRVRAAVSSFKTPEQKLQALQKFYPDAEVIEGEEFGGENFIFTNPENNTPTLFNPRGFDVGDVVEYGREAAQFTGGMLTGTATALGGQVPPFTAVPEEAITVPLAAAAGSEAAGQLYDRAMDFMLPDAFSVSRGTAGEQALQTLENVAMEMVGGKVAEKVIGGIAADVKEPSSPIDMLIDGAPKKITEKVTGMTPDKKRAAQELQLQADELGIELPSAGVVTQSPFLMFLEKRLLQTPTGVGVMRRAVENFRESAVDAVESTAAKYGVPIQEGEAVGAVIRRGAEKAAKDFAYESENLYTAAFNLLPQNASTKLNNVSALRDQFLQRLEQAENTLRPSYSVALQRMEAMLKDIEKGPMSLDILRQARTNLREFMETKGAFDAGVGVTNDQTRYLKQVYEALTKDMNEVVENYGGKQAKIAMSKADKFYKDKMQTDIGPIVNEILNTSTDVQIFNWLNQGAREGGDRIKGIMRNMPKEAQDTIRASVIQRMGMSNPAGSQIYDDFSFARFLTNYKKISESGKEAFFGADREPIEKLVNIFKKMAEADSYTNVSKTGDMVGWAMSLAPLGGALQQAGQGDLTKAALTASSGFVAPWAAAKLLTNKSFVNWLIKAGPDMAKNPNNLKFHFGRLMEITSRDTDLRNAATQYMMALVPSMGEAFAGEEKAYVRNSPEVMLEMSNLVESVNPNSRQKIIDAINAQAMP